MNRLSCCRRASRANAAGAVVSGLALILLPKCPLCVAGWLALFTGIGVSTATAGWLGTGALLLSSMILAMCLWKLCRKAREAG